MGKLDLWQRLELPGEGLPGETLVEIMGDGRVLIEHHRGVREYSRQKISVNVAFGTVSVCGHGLNLRCMTKDQLVITGKIQGITLLRREGR